MRCKALTVINKTRCRHTAVIRGLCLLHLKSEETRKEYVCPDCKGFKTWGAVRCMKCYKSKQIKK